MTKYCPGNLMAPAEELQSSLKVCRRGREKTRAAATTCPIRETLENLGGKWTVLVIISLSGQVRRFNELRREIPNISQRMLTQTLRDLEAIGLVERHLHAAVPPRVDYCLSALGTSLLEPLAALVGWAAQNGEMMRKARTASSGVDAAGLSDSLPDHRRGV